MTFKLFEFKRAIDMSELTSSELIRQKRLKAFEMICSVKEDHPSLHGRFPNEEAKGRALLNTVRDAVHKGLAPRGVFEKTSICFSQFGNIPMILLAFRFSFQHTDPEIVRPS